MNIDKFPLVSSELVEALRGFFPISELTLKEPPEEIQRMVGVYKIINFLEYVNDVQTNPDSE